MRVAGISFDHMHMGDLLQMVHDHPKAQIAALFDPDPARMEPAARRFGVAPDACFTDLDACLTATRPDLALLCAATADHADYTERVARHAVNVMVEKPFADTAANARRMIAAMQPTGKMLAINWPLAWVASHVTARRLIGEGAIGDLLEIHFYDGNRGPLYHVAGKVEVGPEEVERQKPGSWWYKKASGGGSLLDYLGYGATLGTWFMDGEAPLQVTCVTDDAPGIEVDQHSITVCRYARGLSKMETRWGTFTDPWIHQPQPQCGFVFVGADGTLSSYDYTDHVTLQTRARPEQHRHPVDDLPEGRRNPIEYLYRCLAEGQPVSGPLEPQLCLTAQRIVDTAYRSAQEGRTLDLLP